ncbi:hypothetical protein [Methylobrevis albus]|uniref:DUF4231 domain-containing protein n=1 Tax=Methylobrevis albus TaxID=2793297 RepID=A0A931MZY0_9HYPH|nr:hypothetical protein [Methylobrevis albus]MBH0238584.1 hypothetical protein [Methylobrevis albus]
MSNDQTLLADIDASIRQTRFAARRNYFSSQLMFVAAIIGSAAAGGTMLVTDEYRVLAGVVALVPGLCLTLNKELKLTARANWYYQKLQRLRGLRRQLVFEGVAIERVSRRMSELEITLEPGMPSLDDDVGGEALSPSAPVRQVASPPVLTLPAANQSAAPHAAPSQPARANAG